MNGTQYHPFNPLPSHEGRLDFRRAREVQRKLSIHFPLTREDKARLNLDGKKNLSIHFPLTREDRYEDMRPTIVTTFQSTSLSRGKTPGKIPTRASSAFQSTSLSRGKTYGQ